MLTTVEGFADVPYEPLHKLRHGHVVYALKRTQNVADPRAVSQSLMHASLTTTDSIYSVLTENDVGDRSLALNRIVESPTKRRKLPK
jgi:hypothetical protein